MKGRLPSLETLQAHRKAGMKLRQIANLYGVSLNAVQQKLSAGYATTSGVRAGVEYADGRTTSGTYEPDLAALRAPRTTLRDIRDIFIEWNTRRGIW